MIVNVQVFLSIRTALLTLTVVKRCIKVSTSSIDRVQILSLPVVHTTFGRWADQNGMVVDMQKSFKSKCRVADTNCCDAPPKTETQTSTPSSPMLKQLFSSPKNEEVSQQSGSFEWAVLNADSISVSAFSLTFFCIIKTSCMKITKGV